LRVGKHLRQHVCLIIRGAAWNRRDLADEFGQLTCRLRQDDLAGADTACLRFEAHSLSPSGRIVRGRGTPVAVYHDRQIAVLYRRD
jgi:hypothetical protein